MLHLSQGSSINPHIKYSRRTFQPARDNSDNMQRDLSNPVYRKGNTCARCVEKRRVGGGCRDAGAARPSVTALSPTVCGLLIHSSSLGLPVRTIKCGRCQSGGPWRWHSPHSSSSISDAALTGRNQQVYHALWRKRTGIQDGSCLNWQVLDLFCHIMWLSVTGGARHVNVHLKSSFLHVYSLQQDDVV